jgi:hypothetical protein
MASNIEWEALPHADFVRTLSEGIAERDRRTQELFALTGMAPAPAAERRGPGRPAGSANKTARELQIEAAAAADREAVQ